MAKKWTAEERAEFGAKMKAAREARKKPEVKPAAEPGEEPKPEKDDVTVFIKHAITINDFVYQGMVTTSRAFAAELQARSDGVDRRIAKEHDSTVHPDRNLGHLGG